MKTWKILLTALLALSLCLSFAACSEEPATTGDTELDEAIDEAVDEAVDEAFDGGEEEVEQPPQEEDSGETEMPEVDTSAFDHLASQLTSCYMGVASDGSTVYMGMDEEITYAVLAVMSPDTTQSASFVGPVVVEQPSMMITDETTGNTIGFAVTAMENDTYLLDLGDDGEVLVAACATQDLITALAVINNETQAIA